MRIKEMIPNLRSFNFLVNSPFQNQGKFIERRTEKVSTNAGVKRINCCIIFSMRYFNVAYRETSFSAHLWIDSSH